MSAINNETNIEQRTPASVSKNWFNRMVELNKTENKYDIPKMADLVSFIRKDNVDITNFEKCENYFKKQLLPFYQNTPRILEDWFYNEDDYVWCN